MITTSGDSEPVREAILGLEIQDVNKKVHEVCVQVFEATPHATVQNTITVLERWAEMDLTSRLTLSALTVESEDELCALFLLRLIAKEKDTVTFSEVQRSETRLKRLSELAIRTTKADPGTPRMKKSDHPLTFELQIHEESQRSAATGARINASTTLQLGRK